MLEAAFMFWEAENELFINYDSIVQQAFAVKTDGGDNNFRSNLADTLLVSCEFIRAVHFGLIGNGASCLLKWISVSPWNESFKITLCLLA